MNQQAATPRAVGIGDNSAPDYAKQEADRLAQDYAELDRTISDVLESGDELPARIEDDDTETAGLFAKVIKRAGDVWTNVEGFRKLEKQPHMRRSDAVDDYFFAREEKLERRQKNGKAGLVDILRARLHDWNQRKLAKEEAERRAVLQKEENERREAQRKIDDENERLRLANERAERARKPEKIEAHETEAKSAEVAVAGAAVVRDAAQERVDDARAAVSAKPADKVRERHDDGVMTTMKRVPYVEVIDYNLLDAAMLWSFVSDDAKAKALRAWAKVTQHKRQMPGAIIEMRNETVVL